MGILAPLIANEKRPLPSGSPYHRTDRGMRASGSARAASSWTTDPRTRGEAMANPIYTTEAHVTGGRAEGHGRTSDGALEVDLRIPTEMGGPGGGTNPEELFAGGYAACFESALAVIGRRKDQDTQDAAIDSSVSLLPTG